MNVLTVLLQAPAGAAGGGSMMWIMLIAMFVIMYFFMIRPQNKKQKEIANFRKSLQVNQSDTQPYKLNFKVIKSALSKKEEELLKGQKKKIGRAHV